MNLHHHLHRSRLVALLQQWTREEAERAGEGSVRPPAPADVAEQLSQWVGTVEAVKLSRALHAIESFSSGQGAEEEPGARVNLQALERVFDQGKADLAALVTAKPAAPRPARPRADNTPVEVLDPRLEADFTAHGPRYLDLQREMDARLLALRAQVRQALSQGAAPLRQLVALDTVMEQMLEAREQRLWAALPGYLERRLAYRQAQHQRALQARGVADEPQCWRQPGGWLGAFEQDFEALLHAQMQVRVQPISGLLEAARQQNYGKAGQQQ